MTRSRDRISALALTAVLWPGIALADTGVEHLQEALTIAPLSLMTHEGVDVLYFVDAQVLRDRIAGSDLEALRRYGPSQPIGALASIGAAGDLDVWADQSGIALEEMAYFSAAGRPPSNVTFWRPRDTATALEGLPEAGFERLEGAGEGVLANGMPGQQNLVARNPASPWLGATGATSVITPHGEGFIQSFTVEAAAEFAEAGTTLSELDDGQIALEGISQALGDGGRIAQAIVLSPLHLGVLQADPAALLFTDDPRTAVETALEEAGSQVGVPPYSFIMLAEIDGMEGSSTLISLAYGDCDAAQQAGETFVDLWAETELASHDWAVSPAVHEAGQGCAAVISVDDGDAEDGAYGAIFMEAGMPAGFAPLAFGSGE